MAEDWEGIAKLIGFANEKQMLESFYLEEGLPIPEIARKLTCGPATVSSRLAKWGIKTRHRGGANNTASIRKKLFRMDQRQIFLARSKAEQEPIAKMVGGSWSTVYKYMKSVTAVRGDSKWNFASSVRPQA